MISRNACVFFSSYPQKDQIHSPQIVGGAAYTKSLLLQLHRQSPQTQFTVYAETFNDDVPTSYEDNGIKVKRQWVRNNFVSIFRSVLSLSHESANSVVVSYEVNMVGNVFSNIVLFLALTLFIFKRKKIYFALHQVVNSFNEIEKNKIKSSILYFSKQCLFFYLSFLATQLIVFESRLADYLPDPKKVTVIPLAIDEPQKIDKDEARKKLGLKKDEFYMLYFGFLSPYKGIDAFLDLYSKKMGALIIAGNGNPNHIHDKSYQRFLSGVKKKAKDKGVILTGFVPEELIPYYYSACDLVILPYKMFFSSSYPLSIAFSYQKAVLLSPALSGYFKSGDIKQSAVQAHLPQRQVIFEPDVKDVMSKIAYVKSHYDKFISFAAHLTSRRNWSVIAQKYLEILHIM